MSRIKRLSEQEARKIAAGEVIERPVNVVKELIENALDAQATHITLYIEDGGKKSIQVVDNGCGMNTEDAHLCFEHHTTSKITQVDDLDKLNTFGFRGEALSSIAAVSKITLCTKEKEEQVGVQLELTNGSIISEQSISHSQGTDFIIHDIFYNLPARKKFLKTRETEWRIILQLFYAFCLANYSIHFSLYADGKCIYNCPGIHSVMDRITQLWDHHLVQHMLELKQAERENNEYTISGAISNHSYSRFDRSMIFLFVNQRWIKNLHLSRAIIRGYSNVLQPSHYPAAFIFISIDPKYVDINIHPRKEEVKFLHPRIVEMGLQTQINNTLQSYITDHLHKKETKPSCPSPDFPEKTVAVDKKDKEDIITPKYKIDTSISFDFNKPAFNTLTTKLPTTLPHVGQHKDVTKIHMQEIINASYKYVIIGQFDKTYILLENDDGLFFIDQHAAHERILYEKFSKYDKKTATVKLLFPQVIQLGTDDLKSIEPHLHRFKEKGIDIELFGFNQIIVHATPVNLQHISFDDIIKQTVGWITKFHHFDEQELHKALNKKIDAKMACTAAVKAGDILTMQQMKQLIYDLELTENRLTCPHGRPTGWLLQKKEIETKFKRDYKSSIRVTNVID